MRDSGQTKEADIRLISSLFYTFERGLNLI